MGRFTTVDSIIPSPNKTQSFNRYSYVEGNPVGYADYSGHWKVKGTWNKITHAVTKGDNWKNVGRGAAYAAAGAAMGVVAGGLYGAAIGFMAGGPAGAVTGFAKGAAIGAGIGGVNGFLAGYNDIYSHNWKGAAAFVGDSTWSLPNTGAGLIYMAYLKSSGAEFESAYSKQSNAFIFSNAKLNSPGLAIGNIVGTKYSSDDRDFKHTLRHELTHAWQYRIGGLFTSLKLVQEQAMGPYALNVYNPYYSSWNLENQARNQSEREENNRPWYLEGEENDKFY